MPWGQGAGFQNGPIVTGIGKSTAIIHVPKNMSGWITTSVCLYSSFKNAAFYPRKKRMTLHVYAVYIVLSFLILQCIVHNGHLYFYETIHQIWDNGRNKVKLFTIKIREINISVILESNSIMVFKSLQVLFF